MKGSENVPTGDESATTAAKELVRSVFARFEHADNPEEGKR